MRKEIFTIGFEIPGNSDLSREADKMISFMDADIVVMYPDTIYPSYSERVNFSNGGYCYNQNATKKFIALNDRLKKEVDESLKNGKTIFIFLSELNEYSFATNISSPRKGEKTYSTSPMNNYRFASHLLNISPAKGRKLIFNNNSGLGEYYHNFKDFMSYKVCIDNPAPTKEIFLGKNKDKILGAIFKKFNGHIVALPYINFHNPSWTVYNKEEGNEYWSEDATIFGKKLINSLIKIDQIVRNSSDRTEKPEWTTYNDYELKKEVQILEKIKKNETKIQSLSVLNNNLKEELDEVLILKDLLFENGTNLENSVILALEILGYKAENYNDGTLELDQVIKSPEGHRYIGECEGKDNKDINISKFRQLLESLNADFEREEVVEKGYGILFGNPQRLVDVKERSLDFTEKCRIGAKREKIALVKTSDLFVVARYLYENKNASFKKLCRLAIHDSLGKVVNFPPVPLK